MPATAVITSVGLATPLGTTADATWAALLAGGYITDHSQVPMEFTPDAPRVCHLALRAAREASGPRSSPETALVIGTSKGPVESWLGRVAPAGDARGPGLAGIAEIATHVGNALGLAGPRLTICGACASGLLALIRGAMLIESREAARVLVVAAEASLHPLFIGCFERMGVVPAQGVGCRPFDGSRAGFVVSEAAAAICLEATAAGGIGVEHFGMGADAFHLTGPDPHGRTLRRLLESVTRGGPVDLFHAHGTGTSANDPMELAAIESAVPPDEPYADVYSHKGALGHSLGAAGLVSVAINWLAHRTDTIPPNVRSESPVAVSRLRIAREPRRRTIRRSVAIAGGFGGVIAAVSLADGPPDRSSRAT